MRQPIGLSHKTNRNAQLANFITGKKLVMAPGCFDCLTAKLIEKSGFNIAYITGSGVSMSALGAPDMGVISFSEVVERAYRIADSVSIPVICDADTGYGGPINIIRTVREFERAGVSAIQIEDQAWPKKCGHEPGRKLVEPDEMINRIKAAVDTRLDDNFLIIARTDARTSLGLEAAIERAQLYSEAGADVLFVESPESEIEMQQINKMLATPTLANLVEGGRTPILNAKRLEEIGYRLAIYPNSLTRLIAFQSLAMLRALQENGTTKNMADQMLNHRELWDLFDYPEWVALEEKYVSQ
ncbi:isocitrate lyase/PEP mutase family protein [Orrella sp. 11846]|uniref:isocitrate lyase/PEP mutase family protein n=1 Tax=Orrella sp. 11846 TaxID=3409913 RepID=UPI003B5C1E48